MSILLGTRIGTHPSGDNHLLNLREYGNIKILSPKEVFSQPIDALGKLAAKALFNEIKTKNKENIEVVVEPKIIIRKSTRAL